MNIGTGGTWRTSSRSASGACVEVRLGSRGVDVRDSKNRAAAQLRFTASAWTDFVAAVASGAFTQR
jgi:hypothetical protein